MPKRVFMSNTPLIHRLGTGGDAGVLRSHFTVPLSLILATTQTGAFSLFARYPHLRQQ